MLTRGKLDVLGFGEAHSENEDGKGLWECIEG